MLLINCLKCGDMLVPKKQYRQCRCGATTTIIHGETVKVGGFWSVPVYVDVAEPRPDERRIKALAPPKRARDRRPS